MAVRPKSKTRLVGKKIIALLILSGTASLVSAPASAQISIDQMAPASAYAPGVIEQADGGLAPTLWQGTNAAHAAKLLDKVDGNSLKYARALRRAAILSGGVPPFATDGFERDQFRAARLSALLRLRDMKSFDTLSQGYSLNMNAPQFVKLFVEHGLLAGDNTAVCGMVDNHTAERKAPYWAKLRAYCHVVRDEIPAAELTSDLIARSNHKDPVFFELLGKLTGTRPSIKVNSAVTPLQIAMLRLALQNTKTAATDITVEQFPKHLSAEIALAPNTPNELRQSALQASADILDTAQIDQVLRALNVADTSTGFNGNTDTLAGGSSGAPTPTTPSSNKWGVNYAALTNNPGTDTAATALTELLNMANKTEVFAEMARVLNSHAVFVSAEQKAKTGPELYADLAVQMSDIDALRSLYGALPEEHPLRARIALASDALGGGFMLGELGVDIETKLALTGAAKSRAVRDSYIAVAMGANLSSNAADILSGTKLTGTPVNAGKLLALQAAARRGAQAETALIAADLFAKISDSQTPYRADGFAAILSALNTAGLSQQAGWLAAQDILVDTSPSKAK